VTDKKSAGQLIAMSIVIKALVMTHQDHAALRRALVEIMKHGFDTEVDDALQACIDKSVLNWMNSLKTERA